MWTLKHKETTRTSNSSGHGGGGVGVKGSLFGWNPRLDDVSVGPSPCNNNNGESEIFLTPVVSND